MRRYPGVYWRADLKEWWISFGSNGRRVREHGGATQLAAWNARQARMKSLASGMYVGPDLERFTVAEALAELEAHVTNRGIKAPAFYRAHGKAVKDRIGHLRAMKVDGGVLDRYIKGRLDDGRKPATVNKDLQVLRQALRLAVERGRLVRAPRVHLLREDNARQGYFTRAEVKKAAGALAWPYNDFLLWAYWSGRRRSEIRGMTWAMVDLEARELLLPQTKSGQPLRLALEGPLLQIVRRAAAKRTYKDAHAQKRQAKTVFHVRGKPVARFQVAWAAAMKAAGCEGRWFHDLRRTATREMDQAGVPRTVAMAITGHTTEATYRRYAIVQVDDQRTALRRRIKP